MPDHYGRLIAVRPYRHQDLEKDWQEIPVHSYFPSFLGPEGHTDNMPIHNAEFDDNWELSIARSLSVIRYIRAQEKIDPKRLRPVGCAEFHPIEPNDTPEGRALNRRVEIFIEMGQ